MKSIQIKTVLVSVEWLKTNFDAENLVILDASMPKVSGSHSDLNSDKIPNARFFDIKNKFSDTSAEFLNTLPSLEQFENESQNLGINKDSAIVVYDNLGIYSSARAWWLFKVFGHDKIAVLDGGLPEWKKHNFQIEKNSKDVYLKGNFIATLNSKLMTDFEGVKKYSNSKNALVVDARSAERFEGTMQEPRQGLRSGTIPNSVNLPDTEVLNTTKMKTITELQNLFHSLSDPYKTLVFSCGSGITACNLALGATLAGYKNLVVYDGSWTEYGTLTD
jgi:thiosulfate/3-mercaptopyruvate sulfurtransferase